MTLAATVVQTLVRASGLFQIATGLLFWTGNALAWLPYHMLAGMILSLGLAVLGALGAWRGAHPARVVLAVGWAVLTPAFGLNQSNILPGDVHWIVQVAHLLVGLAALWQAEALAAGIRLASRPAIT
jgi:hypothetical protein